MKKNLTAVIMLLAFMFTSCGAIGACDKEVGACKISDLKKITHISQGNDKFITEQKETPKIKVQEKKPTFKEFIKSLLIPSE